MAQSNKQEEMIETAGGIPQSVATRSKLLGERKTGKYVIEFENPKLSYPQIIGEYKDAKGRLVQYKNPETEEVENIVLKPPMEVFDLTTDEGRAKAKHLEGFNLKQRLGLKAKITDTQKTSTKNVESKQKQFSLIMRLKEYFDDPVKLEDLALNLGGIDLENLTTQEVTNEIYKRIEENPDAVEAIVKDPDFDTRSILFLAAKLGVVEEKQGAYYYGQVFLGATIKQACLFCRENGEMLYSIKRDTEA